MKIEDKRVNGVCHLNNLELGDLFELSGEIYVLTCKIGTDEYGDADPEIYACFNLTEKVSRTLSKYKEVEKRTGTLTLD